jgi:hypothetical protein
MKRSIHLKKYIGGKLAKNGDGYALCLIHGQVTESVDEVNCKNCLRRVANGELIKKQPIYL